MITNKIITIKKYKILQIPYPRLNFLLSFLRFVSLVSKILKYIIYYFYGVCFWEVINLTYKQSNSVTLDLIFISSE